MPSNNGESNALAQQIEEGWDALAKYKLAAQLSMPRAAIAVLREKGFSNKPIFV